MKRTVKVVFVLLICILFSQAVLASPEIMPLSQIKPGMKGVGKTVIRGTKIEEFEVEVVSILPSPEEVNQPLILVKTSGDVIEETGGIASGMSGSPVYVDGKLIGAIGYGWEMANHKVGMVTPIRNMLDIFELENKQPKEEEIKLDSPIKIGEKEYTKICFTSESENEIDKDNDNAFVATPVKTPLLVSGLQGRAKRRLADDLKDYDVVPVTAGGLVQKKEEINLKPGSAVAIQLVRGDINVSAVGTLTYRDEDKILAFGHPFLSLGNANYLLSTAYIHKMIKSVKMPFKIGSPVSVKGIISQDRTAGIAGKIGNYPNVIPVEVNVIDENLGVENKFEFQVIQNEDLLQKLSASALLQAVDSTIDRQGGGTAQVNLEIMGNNLPNEVIKKQNLYYSGTDIAAAAITDFLQALEIIITNPFRKVNIANIKYEVKIERNPRIALVEKVKLNKEEVQPGEEITAAVTLRPYRKEVIEKEIKIKVPEDVEQGKMSLHVLSGQEANLDQVISQQQEEQRPAQLNNVKSLEELIKIFQEKNQNNQLIVELRPGYSNAPQAEVEEEKVPGEERYNQYLKREVMEVEYVLQGAVSEEVEVKNKKRKNENNSS